MQDPTYLHPVLLNSSQPYPENRQQILSASRAPAGHRSQCVVAKVGIPVKVNIDSGGKPNGVPERR
jgi:hypothetical protein